MTEKNMQQQPLPQQSAPVTLPFPLAKDRPDGYFVPGEQVIYFCLEGSEGRKKVFWRTGIIHGTPNGTVVMKSHRPFDYYVATEDAAFLKEFPPTSHLLLKRKDAMRLKNHDVAAAWLNGLCSQDEVRKIVREFNTLGFGLVEPVEHWKPPVKKPLVPPRIHHTVR